MVKLITGNFHWNSSKLLMLPSRSPKMEIYILAKTCCALMPMETRVPVTSVVGFRTGSVCLMQTNPRIIQPYVKEIDLRVRIKNANVCGG